MYFFKKYSAYERCFSFSSLCVYMCVGGTVFWKAILWKFWLTSLIWRISVLLIFPHCCSVRWQILGDKVWETETSLWETSLLPDHHLNLNMLVRKMRGTLVTQGILGHGGVQPQMSLHAHLSVHYRKVVYWNNSRMWS